MTKDLKIEINLTLADVGNDPAIVAAGFVCGVVENSGAFSVGRGATFGFKNAATAARAVSFWVGLWIPCWMSVRCRPEQMIFAVEDIFLGFVLSGKQGVALA